MTCKNLYIYLFLKWRQYLCPCTPVYTSLDQREIQIHDVYNWQATEWIGTNSERWLLMHAHLIDTYTHPSCSSDESVGGIHLSATASFRTFRKQWPGSTNIPSTNPHLMAPFFPTRTFSASKFRIQHIETDLLQQLHQNWITLGASPPALPFVDGLVSCISWSAGHGS